MTSLPEATPPRLPTGVRLKLPSAKGLCLNLAASPSQPCFPHTHMGISRKHSCKKSLPHKSSPQGLLLGKWQLQGLWAEQQQLLWVDTYRWPLI